MVAKKWWFCWSLSLLNGYNWGYTLFSDKPIWWLLVLKSCNALFCRWMFPSLSRSSARALHLALKRVQISRGCGCAARCCRTSKTHIQVLPSSSKFFQVLPSSSKFFQGSSHLQSGPEVSELWCIAEDPSIWTAAQSSSIMLKLPSFARQSPCGRCSP